MGNILYIAPALVLVLGILYYAIVDTAVVSTWDWNGISPDHVFVGPKNYAGLVGDQVFWTALRNTGAFALTIPISLGIGMVAAVMAASRVRLSRILRVIVFIPLIVSPAVMAPVFRFMLSPDGTVNTMLSFVGLHGLARPWLANPGTALLSLAMINIWMTTGLAFIFYSAALAAIDERVIEAARIDGAGNFRVIWSFVVPLTKSTTSALLVLTIIGVFKVFEVPYLVSAGGPANSTQFLGTYIYQQSVTDFRFGYGAAVTVVMIIAALALASLQLVRYRRGENA